jgi:hypothetical protein
VLVDLRRLLAPTSYEDVPRDFFDVCHLRPRAYALVGGYVAEQIRPALAATRAPRARAVETAGTPSTGSADHDGTWR